MNVILWSFQIYACPEVFLISVAVGRGCIFVSRGVTLKRNLGGGGTLGWLRGCNSAALTTTGLAFDGSTAGMAINVRLAEVGSEASRLATVN